MCGLSIIRDMCGRLRCASDTLANYKVTEHFSQEQALGPYIYEINYVRINIYCQSCNGPCWPTPNTCRAYAGRNLASGCLFYRSLCTPAHALYAMHSSGHLGRRGGAEGAIFAHGEQQQIERALVQTSGEHQTKYDASKMALHHWAQ